MTDLRILIVPGIVGSAIVDRGGYGRVWLNIGDLTRRGQFELLARTPDGRANANLALQLEADGLLPLLYDELALALSVAFRGSVQTVPYDWRLDIPSLGQTTATRLTRLLEESPERRIILVAHSMGGLVAAHAIRALPETVDRDRIVGLIALGTPWWGSYEAVRYLRGEGPGFRAFCDLTGREEIQLQAVFQSLDGLVGLLPGRDPVAMDPALYARGELGTTEQGLRRLTEVTAMDRTPPRNTHAIVSQALSTITKVVLTENGLETVAGPGDGVVPIGSATYGGSLPCDYVVDNHCILPLSPEVVGLVIKRIHLWTGSTEPVANRIVEEVTAGVAALLGDARRDLLSVASVLHQPQLTRERLLPCLPFLNPGPVPRWVPSARSGLTQ
jgi:pimeloyl-ACP methyl ester carboxylesterase